MEYSLLKSNMQMDMGVHKLVNLDCFANLCSTDRLVSKIDWCGSVCQGQRRTTCHSRRA